MLRGIHASLLGALALAGSALSGHAQNTGEGRPVLVALLETPLPTPTKALVIRYGDGSQPDLIAVSPVGRPEHAIGGALLVLQRARREPLRRAEAEVIHVTAAVPVEDPPVGQQAALLRNLEKVKRGEPREIGSLGTGRVILLPAAVLDDRR
jgi:hypothetical protein